MVSCRIRTSTLTHIRPTCKDLPGRQPNRRSIIQPRRPPTSVRRFRHVATASRALAGHPTCHPSGLSLHRLQALLRHSYQYSHDVKPTRIYPVTPRSRLSTSIDTDADSPDLTVRSHSVRSPYHGVRGFLPRALSVTGQEPNGTSKTHYRRDRRGGRGDR